MTSIYNPAFATNFRLEFAQATHLNYFIQGTTLPGLNAMGIETPYKGNNTFFQADRIEYDPLNVTFIIDEGFDNYLYLYHKLLSYRDTERPPQLQEDATLHILTSNKTPNLLVTFYGLFLQSLGEVTFESSTSDSAALMCSAMFRYQQFTIAKAVT